MNSLCGGLLVNVNQIIVPNNLVICYESFVKELDQYLKEHFGEYYICDQVNLSNEINPQGKVFYVIAFYRTTRCVYYAYENEISPFITAWYEKCFGSSIIRTSITSFTDSMRVYPC